MYQWLFSSLSFLKAQWACCCCRDISMLYKLSSSSSSSHSVDLSFRLLYSVNVMGRFTTDHLRCGISTERGCGWAGTSSRITRTGFGNTSCTGCWPRSTGCSITSSRQYPRNALFPLFWVACFCVCGEYTLDQLVCSRQLFPLIPPHPTPISTQVMPFLSSESFFFFFFSLDSCFSPLCLG